MQCAQAGDWDAVVNLERERKPLLYAVFNAPSLLQLPQQRDALINSILEADHEVVQLAKQHQEKLGGLLRQTGQGRSVVVAYDSNRR